MIQNVNLPSIGYIGFSANTGSLSDIHEIISLKTSGIQDPHHYDHVEYSNHMLDEDLTFMERTGLDRIFRHFWLVMFFGMIIAALAYFYSLNRRMNKDQYRRF